MVRLSKKLNPLEIGHDAEELLTNLRKLVIGQEEAIDQIVGVYQTWLAGLASPGRPIGNFLFLGPTGTGKTRLVEATAESLLGDVQSVLKVDCAEFQHSHEIAKLIGSPPGYLGHRETHPMLSQETLNQYHTDKVKISFVLFDEIEKACDALWNLMLGILDKATLTLGDNKRVDFSHAMIFMTSNLGTAEMDSIMKPRLGFRPYEAECDRMQGEAGRVLDEKVARVGVEAVRRKFTPEFVNRIDKIAVFHPLGHEELERILSLELHRLERRILESAGGTPFVFHLSPAARSYVLHEGTDLKYGARHLKRAIERTLVQPFSNLVASGQVMCGDLVVVDYNPGAESLAFIKEAEQIPSYAMSGMAATSGFGESAAAAATLAEIAVAEPAKAKKERSGYR
jgi:ATP-dependent Clp protease ATP-binding subunit ClpB